MDSRETADKEASQKAQLAQINRALAIFLLFFSAVVLVAVFFTETAAGRLTNLGAGAVIGGIGAAMIYKARRLGRPW